MTDVQVSLEPGSGLERRMRVQVPAVRIDAEVEARLRTAGRTVRLKGFRPGKAPAHVIRQRFGPQIRQEVLQDMVQASYSEAIDRQKLRPAGSPRIEAETSESGQDFSYTAVFEVYPEFKVNGLDALSIERPEPEITDPDINRTIERLQRQKGSWQAVERPAMPGDRVIVDFEGSVDGALLQGGKAERLGIVIGEGRMIADFEAKLAGMSAGARATFVVRFPADYHDEKLRNADVTFAVLAHEVAGLQLPPLDAEFVQGYGIASGDVAEFRIRIRESLEREAAAKVQADSRRQVMERLLAANPVELPSVLVAREAAGLQAEGMRNLGLKDPKEAPPINVYEEVASRRVRLGLIMGALIREYEIKIDQARVDRKLDELCQSYEQPAEVRKLYLQNPELMAQIDNSVMEEQVMAWLLERTRITPRRMSFADLMGG